MKIITTHINKGGTGKSTISYNFASWIAERKNHHESGQGVRPVLWPPGLEHDSGRGAVGLVQGIHERRAAVVEGVANAPPDPLCVGRK